MINHGCHGSCCPLCVCSSMSRLVPVIPRPTASVTMEVCKTQFSRESAQWAAAGPKRKDFQNALSKRKRERERTKRRKYQRGNQRARMEFGTTTTHECSHPGLPGEEELLEPEGIFSMDEIGTTTMAGEDILGVMGRCVFFSLFFAPVWRLWVGGWMEFL